MKEESLEILQNPGHVPLHERNIIWDSVHTLHNLRSLELRLQPRLDIPACIHLAASNLMFYLLLHLLIVHRSTIINLRIVGVG